MKTTRLVKLMIGAILVLVVLVAFRAYHSSGSTKRSSTSYVGIGDLHQIEAQQSIRDTGALNNSRSYVGMGDLIVFEAQVSSHSYAGMGDLLRLEAQGSSRPATGMGDLQRFNAQQVIQNTR